MKLPENVDNSVVCEASQRFEAKVHKQEILISKFEKFHIDPLQSLCDRTLV